MSKWYRGWIAVGGDCRVLVYTGPAIPSLLRVNVAEFPDRVGNETTFDWGRPSRSTLVLARALLADALGRERASHLDAARFMDETLTRFPKGPDWQLTDDEIERWAEGASEPEPELAS